MTENLPAPLRAVDDDVWEIPPPVPDDDDDRHCLAVNMERPLRISPNGMDALEKASGLSMTALFQQESGDSLRVRAMGFAELYRRYDRLGHMPPAETIWAQAGRAYVEFAAPSTADPLDDESSTTSQPSAGTGE
jgi:hypothetical protein